MKKLRPELLISDKKGKIYSVPGLEPAGMKAGNFFRLRRQDLIKLPSGSRLFMLPQRLPVGFDSTSNRFLSLDCNPLFRKKQSCFAVAAFVCPGYTVTYNSAYAQINKPKTLPLFAYAVAAFYKGEFYAAALRVDRELRQDSRFVDMAMVKKNRLKIRKIFPGNRLLAHLENCALVNYCPAAINFFLSRYEAPLPISPGCNADCLGCISYQPQKRCPVTQPRITFVPSPQEISDLALFHIKNVKDPVVSFGQGCEGEPLLEACVIEKAVKLIRKKTSKGIININTNASLPKAVARLFAVGMDSMRVSLNSVRGKYYNKYYNPRGYSLADVVKSINQAKKYKGFVSLNYLTMPGFTDSQQEFRSFKNFLKQQRIDMVQWRNLNFDPREYFTDLGFSIDGNRMLGVKQVITSLHKSLPKLMKGYFNPSRQRMRQHILGRK